MFNFFFNLFKGSPNTPDTASNTDQQPQEKNNRLYLDTSSYDELNKEYLFDFRNYQSGGTYYGSNGNNQEEQKIKIKPIDVLEKLETVPTPFTNTLLDEKIAIFKDKEALIQQQYAKREVQGVIERLENRKRYDEFKDFFETFQNTNDEKIDKILNQYDLVMKTSDIFIPDFPDDAIDVMKKYTEKMMELCGKKPVFYVIAEENLFKKNYEKRDPILLAQSPFGFYWQILGAWDKEMLILSEF